MKTFIFNAVNSWITSLGGIGFGIPEIVSAFAGLFDQDPATGFLLMPLIKGLGIALVGLAARDWTKKVVNPT